MSTIVRLVVVVLVGCISDEDVCAPWGLVEDRVMDRCVCPDGFVEVDAGTCLGPDGGVIRFDAGLREDPDGGVDAPTSCVVGEDGCECEEGASRPCEGGNDVGACSPGSQRCVEGRWTACEGRVDPAPETCNGADDDCNGTPDDGSARTSCGTAPRALATGCSGGGCFVDTCADGFLDCDSEFENGCESELGTPATCSSCGDVCGWACDAGGCNDATRVAAGSGFTVAIQRDGSLVAWGDNEFGQFGDGTNGGGPTPINTLIDGASDVAAGSLHTCAVRSGETWCWGQNFYAQLGDGTQIDRNRPVRVLGSSRGVAAGTAHTCAVRTDGSVWCWGASPPRATAPRRVVTRDAIDVVSGADHSCALMSRGHVECWGVNNLGVLGADSSAYTQETPTPVVDLDDATGLAAGGYTTCAIRAGGTVACWGALVTGAASRPQAIEGLTDVRRLAVGDYRVCAVRGDGVLWCLGVNDAGELGDGTTMRRTSPVRVLDGVADVTLGRNHTCAVLTTGGVRCWGNNDSGQLGTGTRAESLVPTDVLPPR